MELAEAFWTPIYVINRKLNNEGWQYVSVMNQTVSGEILDSANTWDCMGPNAFSIDLSQVLDDNGQALCVGPMIAKIVPA